jgi:tetratricopeptide (TPR) repeat protein
MQSYENALRETVSAGQLVHSAELTYTVSSIAGAVYRDCERSASGFHRKDMTYNEWLCRIVDLLFLSCEGTEIKTTSTGLSSLLGASLKLNSKDAQAFHRVANLLFLKCFLFGSRVNYASISTKSEGNLIFLEKISATSPKWNQGLCESILTRWKECDVGESEQILAKRLLYQWTYSALNGVTKIVSDKMSVLEIKGNYVEAARLGDEYIEFLQEFNNCLDPVFNNCLDPEFNNCLDPVETEFLYTEFYCFYTRTAKLRFKLGEYEQAQSLCEELLRLFRELEDYDDVKIPIWPEGKIVYTQPSVVTMLARRNETLGLMIDSLGAKSQDFSPYQHQLNENLRKLKQLHPGDGILEYSPESLQIPNLSQLTELAVLIQAGRYFSSPSLLQRTAPSFLT